MNIIETQNHYTMATVAEYIGEAVNKYETLASFGFSIEDIAVEIANRHSFDAEDRGMLLYDMMSLKGKTMATSEAIEFFGKDFKPFPSAIIFSFIRARIVDHFNFLPA